MPLPVRATLSPKDDDMADVELLAAAMSMEELPGKRMEELPGKRCKRLF